MKILIIHLSDIHLKQNTDWVVKRIPLIVQAARALVDGMGACFIAITGDLAFAGLNSQYEIAIALLVAMREQLNEEYPDMRVEFVVVPGNHDCDFSSQTAVRSALLDSGNKLLEQVKIDDDSIARALLEPQNHFFEFLARLSSSPARVGYERLFYRQEYRVGSACIRFNCYNTAWVSRLNEKPSELIYPVELIEEPDNQAAIVVSLFHHPTQWLEPNNARLFRNQVEYRSNLILTGHEHVADQYTKQRDLKGQASVYLEGAVLQDGTPKESGFNAIQIDLDNRQKRIFLYAWRRNSYVSVDETDWTKLLDAGQQQQGKFINSETYLSALRDPGANFSHKSRQTMQLSDIYVYPDASLMTLEKNTGKGIPIIDSEKILQFVLEHPKLKISGGDVAGKTSLARTLYVDLSQRGFVPVMLLSTDIKNASTNEIARVIRRRIEEQYDEEAEKQYDQLHKDLRVLIFDDFHKVPLNRDGRALLLETLETKFGRVLLTVDSLFEFQESSQPSASGTSLMKYTHLDISEFGHRLRYKLISKWIRFGQEYTGNEEELRHRTNETAEIVTTLLGRKMVPRYPIFILSMLQALDTNTNLNASSGAFGYFYEVFILQSLSLHRTPGVTMDMITTFLALVGEVMFAKKQMFLSASDWEEVTQDYFREYVSFDRAAMLKILETSKIIARKSGKLQFKYKYVYYYFVAKYLAAALASAARRDEARQTVVGLTNSLDIEAYSNVIIFLVYLTKDENTIAEILERAKEQYAEFSPANLHDDVRFLNNLQLEMPKPSLTPGDADANKDERLRTIDDTERRFEDPQDRETDDYKEPELNDGVRLEIAGRTLQIAGQILRNFPGALPKEQKRQLRFQTHMLGLRMLAMMLDSIDRTKDTFVEAIVSVVAEQQDRDEAETIRYAQYILFGLGGLASYGMLKLIATAVGSEHLKEIYEEALRVDNGIPTRLVDLAIKLDHFHPFPEKEAEALALDLEGNSVALTILRFFVREHFHTEREDYRLRQRVCAKIGIDFRDRRMIEDKHKS